MNAKEFLENKGIKDTLYDVKNPIPNVWIKGGLYELLEEYAASRDSRRALSAMPSEELAQWFENNSDCYADTNDNTVILAMTKEKFVELLQRGIDG